MADVQLPHTVLIKVYKLVATKVTAGLLYPRAFQLPYVVFWAS